MLVFLLDRVKTALASHCMITWNDPPPALILFLTLSCSSFFTSLLPSFPYASVLNLKEEPAVPVDRKLAAARQPGSCTVAAKQTVFRKQCSIPLRAKTTTAGASCFLFFLLLLASLAYLCCLLFSFLGIRLYVSHLHPCFSNTCRIREVFLQ